MFSFVNGMCMREFILLILSYPLVMDLSVNFLFNLANLCRRMLWDLCFVLVESLKMVKYSWM